MRRCFLHAGLVAAATPAAAIASPVEDARPVSLPRQPLAISLQAIARRFGIELLFSQDALAGRVAPAVSGRMAVEQALERVLAGSNLVFRKTADGSYVMASAAAPETDEAPAIPDILVIGRRTQNADIRRSENDIQPYQVVTRREVQRSHAATVEELVGKRLSANAQAATLTQMPATNFGFVRSSINLRGLGTDQTLVLVDGRRMPRLASGDGQLEFLQPDVNGLSPEALERVEVITSTAGGIYGPGATAGVVNLVLRRDYRGAEVVATRGLTSRGDGAYRRLDGRIGFTPDKGATDVMVAFGTSKSDGLSVGDRDFEARARALRFANNPGDIGYFGPVPLSGSINIVSQGTENLVLKPEYGGAALGSRFTSIPLADGRSTAALAADLLAGAGTLDLTPTPGDGGADNTMLTARSTHSLLANVRHRFSSGIEAYLDVVHLATEGKTVADGVRSVNVFSEDLNPFVQSIVYNLPVPIVRDTFRATTRMTRVTAGLIVDLPRRWKANVDYSIGYGSSSYVGSTDGLNGYKALLTGGDDLRRVDPFGDVSTLRADLASYDSYYYRSLRLINRLRDGSIRLAGPVAQLPGGPLAATLLAGERHEHAPSRSIEFDNDLGTGAIPLPDLTERVRSYYAELRAPLFARRAGFLPLRGLELQLAVRRDAAKVRAPNNVVSIDFNKEFIVVDRAATTYTAGLRVTPLPGLMLRASVATGELPLAAEQISTRVDPTNSTIYSDPRRGGQPAGNIDRRFVILSGGSGDVSPERARSLSFGLVLTPLRDAGLRLSLDYTRIDKRGEIVNTYSDEPAYFLAQEAAFPDRVTRLPLTAEDAAQGFTGGVVTQIDTTYLNIGRTRIDAVDAKIDYLWPTPSLGDFNFHAAVSWQPRYSRVMAPGLPTLDYVSAADGALRWRGNGAIGWAKGDLGVVLAGQYYGGYGVRLTGYAVDNEQYVLDQGAERVRAQATFDLALSYRLELERGAGWPRNLDFRFGIQDLLDRSPPIVSNTDGGYSYYADPRRRRFELTMAAGF